jgi:hypothetical protein
MKITDEVLSILDISGGAAVVLASTFPLFKAEDATALIGDPLYPAAMGKAAVLSTMENDFSNIFKYLIEQKKV